MPPSPLKMPARRQRSTVACQACRRRKEDLKQSDRYLSIPVNNAIKIPNGAIQKLTFYSGEHTGITSALDICMSNQSLSKHFLIPSHVSRSLPDEDRNYLRLKGVYTLPGKETCDSLLRAYFNHAHPILPIIEADVVLTYHQAGKLHEYNVLLLWSMFLVAVNVSPPKDLVNLRSTKQTFQFIPAHICEQEGYTSRKEMKATMYSRARCMYSIGGERDKIVLLQSSLLLGCWHSDRDEHMQPWYWTGIAISLCQVLGLHRDPDSSKRNSSITDRQRHLWRRLWWSCFFRDSWLSLTLGRPLRINLKNCDTPMPSADDLLSDVDGIHQSISAAYLPKDLALQAKYWISLIELSKLLGTVINMNYQTLGSKPSICQIESLEAELLQYKLPDQSNHDPTPSATFYWLHLQLHYQALLIAFHRPYASAVPNDLDISRQADWQHQMRLKASLAASQSNAVLDALVQGKLLAFAGPMTPPLLVPAMQTHLLDCKSDDPLSQRLGFLKLDVCMLVMEEFQRTYTTASLYRGVFTKAIQQLFPNYSPRTNASNSATGATAGPIAPDLTTGSTYTLDDPGLDIAITDNLVNELIDEASLFEFFESLNQV
ncbi:uncharacterized protein TRIVIDRAFT_192431 [Trichoderma virens Gv29-8]|uniref:Xylanolytic transcriptional activator regulatory domain-containing protein n=1 Tax=Hypocrea virens (strain Gv29-8 / FGSC 10586) TaxID=413071 RepID=G9MWZ4_HYPVG|nr:uncharacterized protein TRIVIDRAFT_192431 [Trichoderma virens Gv29-8]EHK20927.1 hypothetical protein TRIVIDRAFT_192431 [Trichoderma virens Gv29-8]UKZ52377.1 hypothetical protein TrVGV298_006153 [Trichoderma virens]